MSGVLRYCQLHGGARMAFSGSVLGDVKYSVHFVQMVDIVNNSSR